MKILFEVLFLLMLNKFKHITTDVIEQPKMVNDERFRSTTFGQYDERNETKFSKNHLRRIKMYPRMESSCRKCGLKHRSKFRTLIIHGDLVHPTYLYPWMVAMTKEGELLCTGTIINAYFILTASHCLVKNLNEHKVLEPQSKPLIYYQPEDIGIGLLTSTDKLRVGPPVQKIIPHTQFKPSVWEHDIGLLKLKEKIICSKFANPICLPPPDFDLPIGAKMTISGFGSYNGSTDALGKLRQSKVTKERFEKCPFPRRLERDFYCLKSVKRGQVACYTLSLVVAVFGILVFIILNSLFGITLWLSKCWQKLVVTTALLATNNGDSGGPMFYEQEDKFYILGVSSFGKSCDKKLPFLYTSVPHHLRWIYKNMDLSSTTDKGLRGSGKGKCNKNGRK